MGQASTCLAFSLPQEWEVWDEALVPWLRRQWSRRRYRRHTLAGRLGFLRRRGLVLLCRLGLMAGLLVWSGWSQCWPLSWALLSLPLAAALLSLLLLLWPRLLKVRVYPYLVRGVYDLYLLALMGLFSEGLLHLRDSPWSLLVGGCVRVADGASARGEIDEDGTWRLELDGYESGLLRAHSGRSTRSSMPRPGRRSTNDISQIPIAQILRGQLVGWPPETLQELVPNA